MEERLLSELTFKKFPIIPELAEEELMQLKSSMEDYGFTAPIHINSKNEIMDGNHRALVWQQLGGREIPVILIDKKIPEINSSEMEQEKYQIRMCLCGRNIRDQEKIKQLGKAESTIRYRKERAKKRREGQPVKRKPKIEQWSIDDVCLEIEKHIGKALQYIQSDKFKENWNYISQERQTGFIETLGLFINQLRYLIPKIKTKLIEGGWIDES